MNSRFLQATSAALRQNFSVHFAGQRVTPMLAGTHGNKAFLIYDLLNHPLCPDGLERVHAVVRKNIVDNVLLLRKMQGNAHSLDIKVHVLAPGGIESVVCHDGARAAGAYLIHAHGNKLYTLISNKGGRPIFYDEWSEERAFLSGTNCASPSC